MDTIPGMPLPATIRGQDQEVWHAWMDSLKTVACPPERRQVYLRVVTEFYCVMGKPIRLVTEQDVRDYQEVSLLCGEDQGQVKRHGHIIRTYGNFARTWQQRSQGKQEVELR